MRGRVIRDRVVVADFWPFTIVLRKGERVEVRHLDSVGLPSTEVCGRRIFSSGLTILEAGANEAIERTIELPQIANILDRLPLNGRQRRRKGNR